MRGTSRVSEGTHQNKLLNVGMKQEMRGTFRFTVGMTQWINVPLIIKLALVCECGKDTLTLRSL